MRVKEKKEKELNTLKKSSSELYNFLSQASYLEQNDNRNNGMGAVSQVLSYYRMRQPAISHKEGFSAEFFDELVSKTGLIIRKVELKNNWWKDAVFPLFVAKDEEIFTLFPDMKGEYYFYKDGKKKVINKAMAEEIDSEAWSVSKPIPAKCNTIKSFVGFLFSSIQAKDIYFIMFISIVIEISGLLNPYIVEQVFDKTIPSGSVKNLPGLLILVIGTFLFVALIGLVKTISNVRVCTKIKVIGQAAIWNKIFRLPMSFFKKYDSGEIYNRIKALDAVCDILSEGLVSGFFAVALSSIFLVQMYAYAPKLMSSALLIILLLIVNNVISAFLFVRYNKKKMKANNRNMSVEYELVKSIIKIKTSGAEANTFARWARVWKKTPFVKNIFLNMVNVINFVITVLGAALFYYKVWKFDLDASSFFAFNSSYSMLLASVMALTGLNVKFASFKTSLNMLKPIIEEKAEEYEEKEYVYDLADKIEFINVSFRYSEDTPFIFDDLNLEIENGEYIGIVGESGCGKSTLMRLLLGFEEPTNGAIYYGDKNIDSIFMPSARRRIGTVLQGGRLMTGTVYANIAVCSPGLTIEEAWEAARKAGLAKDIEEMPMGMHTLLSEDGGSISGGQKQRILIARAMASSPDIMLFDEATSALDNETQQIVVDALDNTDCTKIVIAHRLSTIKACDRIIFLKDGKVKETGSYDELVEKKGLFYDMIKRQMV